MNTLNRFKEIYLKKYILEYNKKSLCKNRKEIVSRKVTNIYIYIKDPQR